MDIRLKGGMPGMPMIPPQLPALLTLLGWQTRWALYGPQRTGC